MNTCKYDNCNSTELVYSGVDAFLLGVPTETYCYTCANHMAQLNKINEASDNSPVVLSTTSC
jgi:hypothetical protein